MEHDKEIQIKEGRGLWKASSFVHGLSKKLIRRHEPIRIRYILQAHNILFSETNEKEMAGKYRRNDPDLIRVDGTALPIPNWSKVPGLMAILDEELKTKTADLTPPKTKKDYIKIIDLAVKSSHMLTRIHPFQNGNGRMSRLLINFILYRAGLPAIAIKEDKQKYLKSMLQADKYDLDPLRLLIMKEIISAQSKKIDKQKSLLLPKGKHQKRIIIRPSDFKP